MKTAESQQVIPSLKQALSSLVDTQFPMDTLALHAFSDVSIKELAEFQLAWMETGSARRVDIMQALRDLANESPILDFDQIARTVILIDPSARVRAAAVSTLSDDNNIDIIDPLIQMMQHDPDPSCRSAAAGSLGKYVYLYETGDLSSDHGTLIVETLLDVTECDVENEVRCRALESLGFSSRPEVPPIIKANLKHDDELSVSSSIRAMGRSYDAERWGQDILYALKHPSSQVRQAAVRASGEIQLRLAVDDLIDLFLDSEREIQEMAIWALGEIGGERVCSALNEIQAGCEEDDVLHELAADAMANSKLMESMFDSGLLDDYN